MNTNSTNNNNNNNNINSNTNSNTNFNLNNKNSETNYAKADRFAKLSEKLNQIHVNKNIFNIKKIDKFQ